MPSPDSTGQIHPVEARHAKIEKRNGWGLSIKGGEGLLSVSDAFELSAGEFGGEVAGGTYRVIEPLGSGSMGAVLLAEDAFLNRRVAIKVVHPWLLNSRFRDRFMLEARAVSASGRWLRFAFCEESPCVEIAHTF
jgi:serine/threonine protein kinase